MNVARIKLAKQIKPGVAEQIRALIGPCVLLPIPKGEKGPRTSGWQKLTLADMTQEHVGGLNHGNNIGVLLGEPSGGFCTVDADNDDFLETFLAENLYNGFALSHGQVLEWLRVYNARLSDKWNERELAHKADSAERARYDKPRGWMLNGKQAPPRKVAIKIPKNANFSIKPVKKYVLATDATDISHTSWYAGARTRTEQWRVRNIRGILSWCRI